jgi:intein/homing endonuclease
MEEFTDKYGICHEVVEKGSGFYNVHGEFKKIENIQIGDMVISHDNSIQQVLNTLSYNVDEEIIEIEFENGKTVRCTKEHEFFTSNRGWVSAKDLNEEDDIVEVEKI